MSTVMKENEASHYRIELSKIHMKAYIVFLLLLSEKYSIHLPEEGY